MIKIKPFIFITSIILFFIGCSSEKEITTNTPKVIPAPRLIKKLEGNRRTIKTFDAVGTIQVKSKKFNGKTGFKILIKRPDSIKISIYGPFGIDIAHGLFTKEHFLFYNVMKKKIYTGNNSRNVLQKMFKINLSFENLIDAFAGSVNLTKELHTEPAKYEILDDIYNLTYIDTANNRQTTYRITKQDLKITDYIISTLDGKELLSGEYSQFKKYEGVPLPKVVLIRNKAKHESIKVRYKKIKVNKKQLSLKIKLPSDVEKIEW
jgi:outer membrane lipoprotein-sorting protein